jgi:hypothetical protein
MGTDCRRRTLKECTADVLGHFDRPSTGNGPAEAWSLLLTADASNMPVRTSICLDGLTMDDNHRTLEAAEYPER